MLGKLIKYEFKATARIILPLFGATILFALVSRILMPDPLWYTQGLASALQGIMMFFYFISVFALFIVNLVILIRRFYKSLFRDEGYLTHTLPVTTDQIIFGKLIPAFCWYIAAIIIFGLSAAFVFASSWVFQMVPFGELMHEVQRDLGIYGATVFLLFINLILSSFVWILGFYLALSIGQLFRSARILWSILIYFGLSIVVSITSLILEEIFDIAQIGMGGGGGDMLLLTLATLAQGVIYYFIIRQILKKKLNLS